MTKSVLAFSGSSSSTSINQQLAGHAAAQLKTARARVIDIRDYPMPVYSIDIERNEGFGENARRLQSMFADQDGFLIACPEHNGSMPAMFKNMIDWLSRMEGTVFGDKPVLLLSTSPGKGGGATNLTNLEKLVPWWGGKVTGTLSIGGFADAFDAEAGALRDGAFKDKLAGLVKAFEAVVVGASSV